MTCYIAMVTPEIGSFLYVIRQLTELQQGERTALCMCIFSGFYELEDSHALAHPLWKERLIGCCGYQFFLVESAGTG